MSDLRTITVVIPVRNGVRFLGRCLDALYAQQHAAPELSLCIVAVDNASIDGSADFVVRRYPGVQLIRNSENRGFAGGCNQGLAGHPADVAILLNQDTCVYAGWLRALVRAFDDPAVGVVGCKSFYPGGKRLQHAGAYIQRPRLIGIHYGHREIDGGQGDESRAVEWVTGASFAIRRAVIERVGLLDEGFWPGYFEDMDYCLRTQAAGYQVWYCAEAMLEHQETSSGIAQEVIERFYQRGRLRLSLKHLSPDQWLHEFLPAERRHGMPANQSAILAAMAAAPDLLKTHWQASEQQVQAVLGGLRQLGNFASRQGAEGFSPAPTAVPSGGALRRLWYNVTARRAVQLLQAEQEAANRHHLQHLVALQRQIDELELANSALRQQLAAKRAEQVERRVGDR
jgi:GT2 family glycosyltransferase